MRVGRQPRRLLHHLRGLVPYDLLSMLVSVLFSSLRFRWVLRNAHTHRLHTLMKNLVRVPQNITRRETSCFREELNGH